VGTGAGATQRLTSESARRNPVSPWVAWCPAVELLQVAIGRFCGPLDWCRAGAWSVVQTRGADLPCHLPESRPDQGVLLEGGEQETFEAQTPSVGEPSQSKSVIKICAGDGDRGREGCEVLCTNSEPSFG
jgi:hypothetical protein